MVRIALLALVSSALCFAIGPPAVAATAVTHATEEVATPVTVMKSSNPAATYAIASVGTFSSPRAFIGHAALGMVGDRPADGSKFSASQKPMAGTADTNLAAARADSS